MLDDFLVDVIGMHHTAPDNTVNTMREVVMVADNMCKRLQIGISGNSEMDAMADQLPTRLGLRQDSMEHVAEKLPGELEKAIEFLNVIGG